MSEFINSLIRSFFQGPGSKNRTTETIHVASSQSRRNERLLNEIIMISPRFSNTGGIHYDEENFDWIMIPRYPLPERWQERWCKLIIVLQRDCPAIPPLGFYLNKKFHLKDGGRDGHLTGEAYHGAPDLRKTGWHWYCVTIQNGPGGWQPSADYRKPDNLWTFLNMVRESLTNDF